MIFFFCQGNHKLAPPLAPQLAVYELISALNEQVCMEGDSTCQKEQLTLLWSPSSTMLLPGGNGIITINHHLVPHDSLPKVIGLLSGNRTFPV